VVPVWPACWGYSCSGPTTYFGPKAFNPKADPTIRGTLVSFDLQVEAHVGFTFIGGATLVMNTTGE
jgi:hypothetical protein